MFVNTRLDFDMSSTVELSKYGPYMFVGHRKEKTWAAAARLITGFETSMNMRKTQIQFERLERMVKLCPVDPEKFR
jgi:hypothetical protein